MKKKIAAIALVVCIVVMAIIGATMAYFTDTDTKTNTFTFGKVDITLSEESKASEGVIAGTEKTDGSGYEYGTVLPGLVYSKKPSVSLTNDSSNAWVVVTVTIPKAYDHTNLFNGTENTSTFTVARAETDTDVVYYFYKNTVLEKNYTIPVFREIQINPNLTQEDLNAARKLDVEVKAYAIQETGFTSAYQAYAAAFDKNAPNPNP